MFDRPVRLGVMARARGQLAAVHRAQFAAERLPGHAEPELVPDPLAHVDQPPPDPRRGRQARARSDHRRSRSPAGRCCRAASRAISAARCSSSSRDGWPGALRSIKPSGPCALHRTTQSRMNPVPDDLQPHAAERCGPAACLSLMDPGQRQQAARLASVLAPASLLTRDATRRRVASTSGRSGIGMAPSSSLASLGSAPDRLGRPP